jgi:hypothetical protein
MPQVFVDFLPPDNWQDFERLTRAACRFEWGDDDAETVGRPGQAQNGVDVVGWDYRKNGSWRVGVQCKRRSGRSPDGKVKAGGVITIDEVKGEIEKTKAHSPALKQFIMATTAAQDVALQQEVAVLDVSRRAQQQSGVNIWFWEWFQERLNRHAELAFEYYPEVLRAHNAYDADMHVALVLRTGFDRPLMRTPFHAESGVRSVGVGIERLQQLIATGKLKDAEGEMIASAPPPRKLRSTEDQADIKVIEQNLQTLRNEFVALVSKGVLVEHSYMLEIREYGIQDRMNDLRAEILRRLNRLLERHGIAPVESPLIQ